MSSIKIFVTHISNREDAVINNSLLVDVIAGADYQTKPIPETWVTDNTGDNISKKNKSYCELSTQYWAWKNIEADYYGFCHYRRFLLLSDKKYESNDPSGRGQIFVKDLNTATVDKYHLDDETSMRNYIEKYDCILPQKQDLSILPTPTGMKKSVYKHFEAHDRLFMNKNDLKTLLDVIAKLHPNYLEDAKNFLNGSKFWGYSCFILKKQYFMELCEFEFSVLEELEKQIDTTNYNQQQVRMPGFMGEILSGIYFYHLIKNNTSLKIAETQLVYFAKTEKTPTIEPFKSASLPYVFNLGQVPEFMFLPTLKSFLEHISPDRMYDVILLHWNMKSDFIKYYKTMVSQYKNVRLSFVDNQDIKDTLLELDYYPVDSRILLPWILPKYKTAVVFNWNTFFNSNLDYIENICLDEHLIAGCKNALCIGMANDVSDKYEHYLQDELNIKNKFELINSNAFFINLEKMRTTYSYKDIFSKFNNIKKDISFDETLNLIIQQDIKLLDLEWNYYYTEDSEENRIIKQAPKHILDEFNTSKNCAKTISYNPNFIWSSIPSDYNLKYWNSVRNSDFYHLFLGHMAAIIEHSGKPMFISKPIIRKLAGGFKCIEDHGLLYTIKYAYRRICSI